MSAITSRQTTFASRIEPEENDDAEILISEGWIERGAGRFPRRVRGSEVGRFRRGRFHAGGSKRAHFSARLKEWRRADSAHRDLLPDRRRDRALPRNHGRSSQAIELVEGTLPRGFAFPNGNLVVLSGAELLAATRLMGGGGCNARKSSAATAPKSTSANSMKAISLFTSNTASDGFWQLMRVPTQGGGTQEVLGAGVRK